jgi:hypothetical protein
MWGDQRNSSIWSLPFKKTFGRPWSVRSWGAVGLVLPLAFALGLQDAAAQNQTINLNTGWAGQTNSGPALGQFQPDDNWRMTADPIIPSPLPRPAVAVSNVVTTHIKWPAPLPKSTWISGIGDSYYNSHLPTPPTHFTYEACFNLPALFLGPTLNMQIRADDIVRQVRLNSTALYNEAAGLSQIVHASATKPGSFLGPPLAINYSSAAGFQAGQNCIDVGVDDEQQVISGLNAVATVSYCQFNQQDLSTGVAQWQVNGAPAYATMPYPGWATKDPNGVALAAFPQGTQWIQPANSTTAVNEPGGLYTYVLKFTVPCAGATNVHGWFAADNGATLQIDSNPIVNCAGNPLNCFKQGGMTSIPAQTVSGSGQHTITIKVTNEGNAANMSPMGLLAHITIP